MKGLKASSIKVVMKNGMKYVYKNVEFKECTDCIGVTVPDQNMYCFFYKSSIEAFFVTDAEESKDE